MRHTRTHRAGSILITAMVVTVTLAGTVLVLCRSMRVESMTAANSAASLQAANVLRGAEKYLVAMLAEEGENVRDLSEDQFAAVPIGQGYFWVLRPDYNDTTLPAFGFTEEAAKLNLNNANYDSLLHLPGMTADIASAIMEWKDSDQNVERTGPESEYYGRLPDPFYSKDANFETVEELLMLRDVTRDMLYGDGTAPPLGQQSSFTGSSAYGTDPLLARGWYDLLTIYSRENNTTAAGQRRVNIRDRDDSARRQLRDRLRQLLDARRADQIMDLLGRERPNDIFAFAKLVKLTSEELDKVSDDLTTDGSNNIRGRININTAPRAVLECLPGLDSADVEKLVAARPSINSTANLNAIGWVQEALGERAVGLGTQITTRSLQYSADILAVSGNGRSFKRARIVIDTRVTPARIVYRRDLTDRGWPMDPQILAAIRTGQYAMNSNTNGLGYR